MKILKLEVMDVNHNTIKTYNMFYDDKGESIKITIDDNEHIMNNCGKLIILNPCKIKSSRN